MADLFNEDFLDFINVLNKAEVEYILVGGYAVILHGYARSTADMDVWVNKTPANYHKLKKAFSAIRRPNIFGKRFH
jgi:hypothetical protein